MAPSTFVRPQAAAESVPTADADLHTRVILLVEDDCGDQILMQEALEASRHPLRIQVVSDGEEALEYVYRLGRYSGAAAAPRPDLILLDLNMPRMGGKEVAAKLKSDPQFRAIPIVAFTTSCRAEDVAYCYSVGVNSYVQKPTEFDAFQAILLEVERYWFEVSERLPRLA
jgi:two-component system response regulator